MEQASLDRVTPAAGPAVPQETDSAGVLRAAQDNSSSQAPAQRSGLGWMVGAVFPVALVATWEIAARNAWVPIRYFPPPSSIAETIYGLARSGELMQHIWATLYRVILGFAFGVAAGTVLGALTGYSTAARRVLDPTLQALRSIPSLAWVPLFILWFGIFETSKVMLIAVGVFFPVYLSLAGAIHNVDRKLAEVGRMYRFSGVEMVRYVLLPAALPTYWIGLRSGLGLGWMFVVAAELMGASSGLGFLLVDGQLSTRPAIIIAAIVLFAVIGKITDWLLARAGQRFLHWQDSFKPKG